MVEIISIGKHNPYGMIIDVDEDKAKLLIDSGDYEYVNKTKEEEEIIYKKRIVPDESWNISKIKKWIKEEELDIDIEQNITKDILLSKLKDKGYL